MTLTVLYADDGRILALTRQRPEPPPIDDDAPPLMRAGVDPQAGQRSAVLDLDPALAAMSLADIMLRHGVVEDADGVRLQPRSDRDTAD